MAFDYVLERELAFNETDMAGIAHFSNFFRWMEITEHAFLKSIGIDPVVQERDKFWGWPRVRASCEYHSPLRFGDAFEAHLFVKSSRAQSGAALSVIPPHTNTACRSHDVASS